MQFKMKCVNPEDLEYTMTITMKVKEWRELQAHMEDHWPGYDFKLAIDDILTQANLTYFPKDPE